MPSRSRPSKRRARSRSTTNSPRRSVSNRSPSCAKWCASASSASTPRASRQKVKRALLDALDAEHKFDPPPTLVEEEFNSVWTTIENDLKQQGRTFADEGTTEEKAREEYRGIAERRVRLGLVIAEIGEKNDIKVSEDQLTQAVVAQARMMPGQEQKVWDYYRNNPSALAALRAPIFEDKVVDFLLELADVTDKQVSREELFKEDEE